jgi:hypothetical protein
MPYPAAKPAMSAASTIETMMLMPLSGRGFMVFAPGPGCRGSSTGSSGLGGLNRLPSWLSEPKLCHADRPDLRYADRIVNTILPYAGNESKNS